MNRVRIASNKIHAFARITHFMNLLKSKSIMHACVNAQFNYLLVWIIIAKKYSNRIKHLHERCLRIVYSVYASSYEELLYKDDSVSVHHKGLQTLPVAAA